jgi:hypothetical protein
MYFFACDINFASFYDLSTEFWQCSDNMVIQFKGCNFCSKKKLQIFCLEAVVWTC